MLLVGDTIDVDGLAGVVFEIVGDQARVMLPNGQMITTPCETDAVEGFDEEICFRGRQYDD